MKKKQLIAYLLILNSLVMCGCNSKKNKDDFNDHKNIIETEVIDNIAKNEVQVEIPKDNNAEFGNIVLCETQAFLKEDTPFLDDNLNVIIISKYQKVNIIDFQESLLTVITEGGFIANLTLNDLEILPSSFVEVDISDQKLKFYENNMESFNYDVVTGSDYTPTPLGYFTVDQKLYGTYLVGAGYKSWVDYWIQFESNRGIGIHDASWRNEFGGEIYHTNGSHGCVNSPYEEVEKLYNEVEIGTRVLIHK